MKRKARLVINTYSVVSDAVDNGIQLGLNRAYKHTDHPSKELILSSIDDAIMSELSEVIQWNNVERVVVQWDNGSNNDVVNGSNNDSDFDGGI